MSIAMEHRPLPHRIDVHKLHRMSEAGELDDFERVELIDGVIFDMGIPGIDHSWIVDRLNALVHGARGSGVAISVGPLRLDNFNEFIPDITLLIGPRSRYRHRFPMGEDVLLAIEVSDTTLWKDMKLKLPRYASFGVAEAWVINVQKMEVYVQRVEGPGGVVQSFTAKCTEKLALSRMPDVEIDLSVLLEEE